MKISADFILTEDFRLRNGLYIDISDDGTIREIAEKSNNESGIRHYEGIISPGFFNCHMHLELAGADFGTSEGLEDFLKTMKEYLENSENSENSAEILRLDKDLFEQGIEFCADISNTEKTLDIKSKSRIRYHNFIELYESLHDDPEIIFQKAEQQCDKFKKNKLTASICPHSCYSVSPALTKLISAYNKDNKEISSIHFKENFKENDLFVFQHFIYSSLNISYLKKFTKKFYERNVLDVLNEIFEPDQRVIYVHAIYLNEKERKWLLKHQQNCALCLCPVSNMNIEKNMIRKKQLEFFKDNIFFGTDSPASNPEMKFIKELFLAQKNFNLPTEQILKMATYDPSLFFDQRDKGIIQKGKKPGLVNIRNIDQKKMLFTGKTTTTRIA